MPFPYFSHSIQKKLCHCVIILYGYVVIKYSNKISNKISFLSSSLEKIVFTTFDHNSMMQDCNARHFEKSWKAGCKVDVLKDSFITTRHHPLHLLI